MKCRTCASEHRTSRGRTSTFSSAHAPMVRNGVLTHSANNQLTMLRQAHQCYNMDGTALRPELPITERWAYFDHAAVAPITLRAARAMREWTGDLFPHGLML